MNSGNRVFSWRKTVPAVLWSPESRPVWLKVVRHTQNLSLVAGRLVYRIADRDSPPTWWPGRNSWQQPRQPHPGFIAKIEVERQGNERHGCAPVTNGIWVTKPKVRHDIVACGLLVDYPWDPEIKGGADEGGDTDNKKSIHIISYKVLWTARFDGCWAPERFCSFCKLLRVS